MSTSAVPRDRFASLLEQPSVGAFSARRTARADHLLLEVRGVGPIAFPVPAAQAKQLCLLGRPAHFGRGEQTLLDAGVRDTWEIPKSRIKIDKRQWNTTIRPVLDRLRADLGLPQGCELVAEFHSMLVYAPGQFFAPHQDSEKAEAMIGTLVVTLPSASQGGVLTVEHGGRTVTYRSSKDLLTFVAFYADCRHHVQPVTSGYRVVLTYNLVLKGDAVAAAGGQVDQDLVAKLTGCLEEHFAGSEDPARLVLLLDHEYTQRALSWARLKGDDVGRAALVRAAAAAADCEVALALVELHESWSTSPAESSWRGRRSRYWDDDDDESDEVDPDDYELDEMIESSIKLDWWLDDSGQATPTSLTVLEEEVCATTATADLTPSSSEYEGYMGNYGNTLDRWYRRAAVVSWPRRWSFAVRGEASPGWALNHLAERIRAGDVAGARESAAMLTSFWRVPADGGLMLGRALGVAGDLDDPGLAATLLAPFRIGALDPAAAPSLAALADRYGDAWMTERIADWFGRDWPAPSWSPTAGTWPESLPALCTALTAVSETGATVGRLLAAGTWTRLRRQASDLREFPVASRRRSELVALGPSVSRVLTSAVIVTAVDVRDDALAFLSQDDPDLLACAIATLRDAHKSERGIGSETGFDLLARQCAVRLQERIARPARAADDWSITLPSGCGCDLCSTLGDFLTDSARRSFEWPLAAPRRSHVHSRISQAELPVEHQTRRTGRPYTLVLRKTDALFEQAEQARREDLADLSWLRTEGGAA